MKKRIFLIILAFTFCFCMTGCDFLNTPPHRDETQPNIVDKANTYPVDSSSFELTGPFTRENSKFLQINIKNVSERTLFEVLITIGFFKDSTLIFTEQSGVHMQFEPDTTVNFFVIEPQKLEGITEIKIVKARENWFGGLV